MKHKGILLFFAIAIACGCVFLACEQMIGGNTEPEGSYSYKTYASNSSTSALVNSDGTAGTVDAQLDSDQYGSAICYYPSNLSGKLPSVSLSGGWTNFKEDMQWIAIKLVKYGFIVLDMEPNNNMGDPPDWEKAHKGAIDKLIKENSRFGSPINGKVDTNRLGCVGFSKGGGGVLYVANDNYPNVKTVVGMSPWMWGVIVGDAGVETSKINIPVFFYTGSQDELAWGDSVREMFNGLPGTKDRLYIDFKDLDHFAQYGPDATVKDYDRKVTSTYIIAWLMHYLKGVTTYDSYFNTGADSSGGGSDWQANNNAGWFYDYWFNQNKVVHNSAPDIP